MGCIVVYFFLPIQDVDEASIHQDWDAGPGTPKHSDREGEGQAAHQEHVGPAVQDHHAVHQGPLLLLLQHH